ncbi:MAG: hypothetical protein WCY23_02995 [Candidatus Omnitrophota bacterium]
MLWCRKVYRRQRRGIALIMVVGVLGMLTLIGVSFASTTQVVYKEAKNYAYSVKSRYLAEAGIARAVAELRCGPEGAVSDAVDTQAEGWYAGCSGALGSGGYTVSGIDCASRIYINDTNPNLGAILGNLTAVLISMGKPLAAGDGAAIISNRPAEGYMSEEEVKEPFRDYVTVRAFRDTAVYSNASPFPAEPRAPVNVNTASKPVLKAVLTGIEAKHACPRCGGDGTIFASSGCPDCGSTGDLKITAAEADGLADYIIANRPYSTWPQFYNSIKSCGSIGNKDADLVMANANPNAGFAPGARDHGWALGTGQIGKYIDPADAGRGLTTYTTEFCFNSGGYYEITSIGTANNPAGAAAATKRLKYAVKIFDIWRQTTQSEFETGAISNLQSYPEPISAGIAPAVFDGQLKLASKEETSTANTLLRASFNNDLDPDSAASANIIRNPASTCAAGSVTDAADPGSLLPDGVFVNKRFNDYISFMENWSGAYNMAKADMGTLSLWVKVVTGGEVYSGMSFSGYEIDTYGNGHTDGGPPWDFSLFEIHPSGFIPGSPYGDWNWWRPGYANRTEVWFYEQWDAALPERPVGFIGFQEVGSGIGGSNVSQIMTTGRARKNWAPGTWHRVVFTYELSNPADPLCMTGTKKLYIDGVEPPHYAYDTIYHRLNGDVRDITIGTSDINNSHSDGTYIIDEFRSEHACATAAQVMADFASGRYYDNSDAEFTSSSYDAGTARLGTVSWAEYMPASVAGGDIQFDVDNGSGWLGGYAARNDPAGSPVNAMTAGSNLIRYKAYFVNSGTGLTDTPVLDDVTVTYLKKAEILYSKEE